MPVWYSCLHVELCSAPWVRADTWMAAASLTPAMLQASFVGAMAIADVVKSTLGPKGMVRHNITFPALYFCKADLRG